ncbi:MAG: polysaccharide biosynthesis tyrosine autokinase, partial [Fulvivirga sp.]|uniref:GumC family protein n=1 Tax=Fulvivirga sp. TaxID=1931237 RepID=UPI0032ECED6F
MEHGMNGRLPEREGGIDFQRIIFLILKYWYFIVLSLLMSVTIAYLLNRYTVRIYPVSMTILIKDEPEKDNSIVDLLYNGRGFTPGKNYLNEEILLKSYPLVKKAIDSLDFQISVWKEGDIKTTEIYPNPFDIIIDNKNQKQIYGARFKLKVLNKDQFEISRIGSTSSFSKYKFNDYVEVNGIRLKIRNPNSSAFQGDTYELRFLNNSAIASSYTGKLNVSWLQKGASIIKLSVNGPTPLKESDFLMQLAKTYQHDDLLEKNESASRTIKFIDEQLQIIRDSLVTLESSLQNFKEVNYVTGLKDEAVRFYDEMESLSKEKAELLIQQKYLDYLNDYLTERENYNELTVPASFDINNTILNEQVQQLIKLQLEKNSILRNSSKDSPFITEINQQINDLKSSLKETISSLGASLNLALNATNIEINRIEKQLAKLPKAEREYISLNRLFKLSENLYLILMEKKAEASITQASNTSDIVIVNPPSIGGPITPKTRQNYLLAILAGIGIPIGLIVLVDLLNDKIKFKEDIEKHTSIPFMGVIGHNQKDQNLIVEAAPRSAISESFRSVRSNLNFFTSDIKNKVILITSALSGEGKTFFSNNLALIHAYSGKKTILIGADMRRPKILKDFEISEEYGLSDYLAGNSSINEIIQSTRFENLDIINSGTVPPNPSELLLKPATSKLIEELKKSYEYIIIDSPPIGLVTDSLI